MQNRFSSHYFSFSAHCVCIFVNSLFLVFSKLFIITCMLVHNKKVLNSFLHCCMCFFLICSIRKEARVIPCQIYILFHVISYPGHDTLTSPILFIFSIFVDSAKMVNLWKFQSSTCYGSEVIEIRKFDWNGCFKVKSANLNLHFPY